MSRPDGRSNDELRPVTFVVDFVRSATGSVLIEQGETRVICTASVVDNVPRWMAGQGRGWVTAEYGMLPASTGDRKQRDVTKGRLDGRSVEIQRLIGRSLRGVIDFEALGERTVWIEGEPHEVGPVNFAPDLSRVGDLSFTEWSAREDDTNALLLRTKYRQPFGTFKGTLPDGTELREGHGVMESHDVKW